MADDVMNTQGRKDVGVASLDYVRAHVVDDDSNEESDDAEVLVLYSFLKRAFYKTAALTLYALRKIIM